MRIQTLAQRLCKCTALWSWST